MNASTLDESVAPATPVSSPSLFANRNYRLHWIGTAISCLGDYFTLIAMPWLVLSLTSDASVLGIVMALESLPRAAFMLVSGRFSDRYTPLKVIIAGRSLFMLALVALALLLLTGRLQVQHLYVFSLVFGLLSAFTMPATTALLPRLIDRDQIQKGNSALMGTRQMIQLFAPVLAGLLIWGMPGVDSKTNGDTGQIAWSFILNALAIFISLLMIRNIRLAPLTAGPATGPDKVRLADGFAYLWKDRGLRIATSYMACVGFCAIGPLLTVIPQFAAQRLDNGALSYGLLYSVNGLGAMLGFAMGGLLPKPGARHLGLIVLGADLVAGLCIIGFGQSSSLVSAGPALAVMGMANAYAGVTALSWIQQRIPDALAGRVIGVVMFATMGLAPVSMSLSGVIIAHSSLTTLLLMSGCTVVMVSLIGLLIPAINRFGAYAVPDLEAPTAIQQVA
jgi:Na+/melibiose symporter-like transporter